MKKQLLIAGGSGLIGSAIREEAERRGMEVTILSRNEGPGRIAWNPQKRNIGLTDARSFDAVINLAGSSIAEGRWTRKRKQDIAESRINACLTLEKYLGEGLLKTPLYIGASAIGIYGDRKSEKVDEYSHIEAEGNWMVTTVLDWEEGHRKVEGLGIRMVIYRIGILLSMKGGALPELLQTSPFGILGYFGNGRQMVPWIHIDDLVRIFFLPLTDDHMHGPYLAVAPHPVSSKELATVASTEYAPRRVVVPVPAFVLGILLGEMRQMLLHSCNAFPTRLINEGFHFRYERIREAMHNLIRK